MVYLPVRRTPSGVSSVLGDMGRMLDTWCGQPSNQMRQEGLWHPLMDVYDGDKEIVVELEIPGIDPDKIEVSIEEDHLFVEGSRANSRENGSDGRYYSERPSGGFHRIVHLSCSVDPDNVHAKYRDGILEITLPKQERARGKKIEVS